MVLLDPAGQEKKSRILRFSRFLRFRKLRRKKLIEPGIQEHGRFSAPGASGGSKIVLRTIWHENAASIFIKRA
jgi:hypothetical protein